MPARRGESNGSRATSQGHGREDQRPGMMRSRWVVLSAMLAAAGCGGHRFPEYALMGAAIVSVRDADEALAAHNRDCGGFPDSLEKVGPDVGKRAACMKSGWVQNPKRLAPSGYELRYDPADAAGPLFEHYQ